MTLPGGWLLAPLVLALLVTGIGLLVERLARVRLPGGLVPGVGLAGLMVIAGIPTIWEPTAPAATPLCVLAALAGLVLGRPWADERIRDAWWVGLVVAGGAYAVYAAPSLLTGQGSIAGYVKLDDSATWLALTDHAMRHGRDLSGLAPSTYQQALHIWMGTGYPVGSFLPMGVASFATFQDPANVFQPTVAFYAAVLALGLYSAARGFVRTRAAAIAVALVAVQASLMLGYAQWGGIKEMATVALLPAAAVAGLGGRGPRALPVVALVAAALLGVLGVNGLAWAGPALLLGWIATRPGLRATAGSAALFLAGSAPALATIKFAKATTGGGVINNEAELGNLGRPLDLLQGAGLWPVGDFRAIADPKWIAVVLAVGGLLAAAGAVALGVRRRAWELPALVAVTLAGAIPAVVIGAPWIDAKALAMTSGILLAATVALVALGVEQRRFPAAMAGGLLAVGCAWSTLQIVRDVYVAPRERLAELREVAERLEGRSPVVVLDYEIYAQRHFLRNSDPEGATDLRVRQVPSNAGTIFPSLTVAEVDDVQPAALAVYEGIVRRRTPVGSRPPSNFERVWAGPAFEAWVRRPDAPPVLVHRTLGAPTAPVAVPDCADVRKLARTPEARTIAAVPRTQPVVAALSEPAFDRTSTVTVEVPSDGRWRVWVGGSVLGTLEVSVGDRSLGSLRHELAHTGQWMRFGIVELPAGRHSIRLHHSRGGILQGGRGAPDAQPGIGPVALTPAADDEPQRVERVPVADATRLCDGRSYDWLEALAG